MSEITPFDFNGNSVRVLTIDGEPWWVASDVCDALDIANARDAMARLDSDDVGQADVVDVAGRRNPRTNIINESGLYELVIRSDKPAARPFRRWVTSEVLPAIRRTGAYAVEPVRPMSPLDTLTLMVEQMRAQEARTLAIEAKLSGVAGEYDEFIALAYAKLNDLPTDRPYLSRLGKTASRIMRDRGREPRTRQDATFGAVNVYPVDVLDEAAEALS